MLAQQPALKVLRGFTWPEFYPPPHETQLRFVLKGAEAVPQAEGRYLIKQVALEKFQTSGVREFLIETPECVFNSETREVNSTATLRVQFEDPRFTMEGEGFLWRQTNASLVVSNRVRTSLRGGWQAAKPGSPATTTLPLELGDTEIRSGRFEFDQKSSLAVYRHHVQVTSSNLSLACGTLTFTLPKTGTNALENLTAEESVAIDFGGKRATGTKAVYAPRDGVMRLTGPATWQAEGREGRGNELCLDNAAQSLQVKGDARLRLPVNNSGFIPEQARGSQMPGATNGLVTITSEQYELQTNRASFTGGVKVVEQIGGQERASLDCGRLSVALGASNQVQQLVAEQRVVIVAGNRRLAGERAAYDGANGVLEITGQPTWQDGQYSGQGQLLTANLSRNEFAVKGNAGIVLPRTQRGSLLDALAMKPGMGPPLTAKTNVATTPRLTRVFCDEYQFRPEALSFRGHVRVDDAQMQLTSGALDVKLSPGGTNVISLVAEQDVVMHLVESSNQTSQVTCARAVYTGTNDVLELTGQPAVQQWLASGTNTFSAEAILLDRKTGSISTRGIARGSLTPTDRQTNALTLPFDKKP